METIQIILAVTVLVLTAILSIVGFEFFLILKEIRQSVQKMNKILTDFGVISESIARPISGLSDLTVGIRGILEFINSLISSRKDSEKIKVDNKSDNKKENLSSGEISVFADEDKGGSKKIEPQVLPRHRFFLRNGKKLS